MGVLKHALQDLRKLSFTSVLASQVPMLSKACPVFLVYPVCPFSPVCPAYPACPIFPVLNGCFCVISLFKTLNVDVDVLRWTILEILKLLFAPGRSDANSCVTGDSWPQNA